MLGQQRVASGHVWSSGYVWRWFGVSMRSGQQVLVLTDILYTQGACVTIGDGTSICPAARSCSPPASTAKQRQWCMAASLAQQTTLLLWESLIAAGNLASPLCHTVVIHLSTGHAPHSSLSENVVAAACIFHIGDHSCPMVQHL